MPARSAPTVRRERWPIKSPHSCQGAGLAVVPINLCKASPSTATEPGTAGGVSIHALGDPPPGSAASGAGRGRMTQLPWPAPAHAQRSKPHPQRQSARGCHGVFLGSLPLLHGLQQLLTVKRDASAHQRKCYKGNQQDIPSDPLSPALCPVLIQRDNPRQGPQR